MLLCTLVYILQGTFIQSKTWDTSVEEYPVLSDPTTFCTKSVHTLYIHSMLAISTNFHQKSCIDGKECNANSTQPPPGCLCYSWRTFTVFLDEWGFKTTNCAWLRLSESNSNVIGVILILHGTGLYVKHAQTAPEHPYTKCRQTCFLRSYRNLLVCQRSEWFWFLPALQYLIWDHISWPQQLLNIISRAVKR